MSPEEPIVAPMADLPAVSPEQMTAPPEPPPQPRWAAGSGKSLEQVLAENWLVWLGGLTLALGGAFLVKLSIDHGLLTPAHPRRCSEVCSGSVWRSAPTWWPRRERTAEPGADRCFLTFRRRSPQPVPRRCSPASTRLINSTTCSPSVSGLSSPRRTAEATVIMVATARSIRCDARPSRRLPRALAGAKRNAASIALIRLSGLCCRRFARIVADRAWWWLAWLSLAGTIFWVLAWLAASGNHPATLVVAGFLVLQLALFGAFRRGIDRVAFLSGIGEAPMVRIVTRSAFWAVAAAMVVLVHVDGFGETSLAAVFLAALFLLWFGFRDHALDDVIAVAGALLLAVLASWNLPCRRARPCCWRTQDSR